MILDVLMSLSLEPFYSSRVAASASEVSGFASAPRKASPKPESLHAPALAPAAKFVA
jgi:hypothetical protein